MLQLGQVLKGRLGSYQLTRRLQNSIWLAVNQQAENNVIIKYVQHWRIANERDMLLRFQGRSQHIRPLLDEIELETEGKKWPALVLKWLDDDVLHTSINRPLTQTELKRVGWGVLKALDVIHGDGYVHTDIKPNNILVNYSPSDKQIIDVQLADLESTVHEDSKHAKDGEEIGTTVFRSTEAILQMRWGTATDVWSFGTMMISLIYGGDFHIFKPDVPIDHDEYDIEVMMKQHQFFGPFPLSYQEIAGEDRLEALAYVMNNMPGYRTPFELVSNREVSDENKRFVLRIMKLDPRDRPTVRELLTDKWFASVQTG